MYALYFQPEVYLFILYQDQDSHVFSASSYSQAGAMLYQIIVKLSEWWLNSP